ncbi:MAG: NUDIX hydrolase [Gammaproteobacteria bacterium]
MQEIDKLAWLYVKDQRLLVARSKGQATFYIPGGKRETRESDQAALIREIKEELSVDLIPTTIVYIETFTAQAHEKPNRMPVKITCYQAEFIGTIEASTEIEEIAWLSYQDKTRCSPVTQLIMDWLKAKGIF